MVAMFDGTFAKSRWQGMVIGFPRTLKYRVLVCVSTSQLTIFCFCDHAEMAASVPRTEIVGKGDYFRFGKRDSLAIEASFLQVGWWLVMS